MELWAHLFPAHYSGKNPDITEFVGYLSYSSKGSLELLSVASFWKFPETHIFHK